MIETAPGLKCCVKGIEQRRGAGFLPEYIIARMYLSCLSRFLARIHHSKDVSLLPVLSVLIYCFEHMVQFYISNRAAMVIRLFRMFSIANR